MIRLEDVAWKYETTSTNKFCGAALNFLNVSSYFNKIYWQGYEL